MPVCGRVTLLPHPPEPCCHSPLFRHPAQPAGRFDPPRLADLICIINSITDLVQHVQACSQFVVWIASINNASSIVESHPVRTLSMTTLKSDAPSWMPARRSLSFLYACAQPLAYRYSQQTLDPSLHIPHHHPLEQTIFRLLIIISPTPRPCPLLLVRPFGSRSIAPASLPNARCSVASLSQTCIGRISSLICLVRRLRNVPCHAAACSSPCAIIR